VDGKAVGTSVDGIEVLVLDFLLGLDLVFVFVSNDLPASLVEAFLDLGAASVLVKGAVAGEEGAVVLVVPLASLVEAFLDLGAASILVKGAVAGEEGAVVLVVPLGNVILGTEVALGCCFCFKALGTAGRSVVPFALVALGALFVRGWDSSPFIARLKLLLLYWEKTCCCSWA